MASSDRTCLDVELRAERGSRAARRLRRSGYVPGVVYGIGGGTVAFKAEALRLRAVLAEGHALFDVAVDGDREPVIVKEQQREPIHGRVVHIDLLKVRLDEKIQATVALELDGVEEAPGVKEGGVLEHVTREVTIEALPTDIPEAIQVDVSGLQILEPPLLSLLARTARALRERGGKFVVIDNEARVRMSPKGRSISSCRTSTRSRSTFSAPRAGPTERPAGEP